MKFKNITPYHLHQLPPQMQGDPISIGQQVDLSEALDQHRFHPRIKYHQSSVGWVPPVDNTEMLVFPGGDALLITLQIEEAILPAGTVKKAVADKVSRIEEAECRKVYRAERMSIHDDMVIEMLPRALSRYKRIDAMIIPSANLLLVGAGSYNTAEVLLNALRESLGSLHVTPLNIKHNPHTIMTSWIKNPHEGDFPANYSFGGGVRLSDGSANGATAVFDDIALDEDLIPHLDSGMIVTRIDLEHESIGFFTLNNSLQILKLRLNTDHPQHQILIDGADGDPLLEAQADINLVSYAALTILADMIKAFGGLYNPITASGDPNE